MRDGLRHLKEFIKKEDLSGNFNEKFLMQCLRVQKFNKKKSEAKFYKHHQMQRVLADLFKDMDISKIRLILDRKMFGLLPYRDQHGRAIFFTRASAWDPELFDLNQAAQCAIGLHYFACTFPLTTMAGISYITDTKANSVRDYLPLCSTYKNLLPLLMSIPVRFQRFDVMNENFILRNFYQLMRHLLPLKLTKRVHMNGSNFKKLQKTFHPSVLPYEFGGSMGPLSNDAYKEKFLDFIVKFRSQIL
ncbi:alpha-tocopherol transfer protein-like [Uloborus diversus]|uniref:alpha-tocopherol transfer protein-like n=1 Tax=Uloborus diversus TaxID=327109 RepID=UPI002409AFBC|nr:alpha-tocopherol transfer protein-like [Uloborus diversus]